MKRVSVTAVLIFIASLAAVAQEKPEANGAVHYLRCGALFQPESGQMRRNVLITIQGDRIKDVRENAQAPAGATAIDLGDHTCLPGLMDTHTHTLLQGDITAADYDDQLLKESTAYRAILGTRNVRRALEYGFTTIRDVETEGAGYADVDLKKAINNGVIPGPRMKRAKLFASRSASAPTGSKSIRTGVISFAPTASSMTFLPSRWMSCAPSSTKRTASITK
jgi:imidazolonepropionase-like amidohydrolase